MFALIVYGVIGFLLANGVPHLAAGAGEIIFRSPFGRYSQPKTNFLWGWANLIVAIILLLWRFSVDTAATGQMVALIIGATIAYFQFGFAAKRFFDDRTPKLAQKKDLK